MALATSRARVPVYRVSAPSPATISSVLTYSALTTYCHTRFWVPSSLQYLCRPVREKAISSVWAAWPRSGPKTQNSNTRDHHFDPNHFRRSDIVGIDNRLPHTFRFPVIIEVKLRARTRKSDTFGMGRVAQVGPHGPELFHVGPYYPPPAAHVNGWLDHITPRQRAI